MRALLVAGSARTESHTRSVVGTVGEYLEAEGVEVEMWDLGERPLPPFEVPFHKDQSKIEDEEAKQFIDMLNDADMIVLGTPLYHGSYSGILKNALDYLLKDQLYEKPVGLVSNGGGNTKNAQALNHLTTIVHTLYGVPMQTQIGTHGADFTDMEVSNQDILDRCERLAKEMVRFHKALA